MPRIIFHVDMDAFFASVEQRDNPEYRGKPLVVGALADQRGVVAAASYEVRKYGVRSAMPSRTAARLCPSAIFVRPRMDAYRAESHRIMEIFRELTPTLEKVSVDEAYLEISDRFPDLEADDALFQSVEMAKALKQRIFSERGLTASIGIAANKFLAKLGSDFQKPNGLTLIPERDKALFLRPLSVSAIPGVGPVTAETLAKHGIRTIADLQDRSGMLATVVGSYAATLRARAFGDDDRPLDTSEERKSISSETTFAEDTDNRPILRAALKELALDVADTLRKNGVAALTVQVKVRYSDFTTLTRQVRLIEPVHQPEEIYRTACHLLARDRLVTQPLRLLGIGVSTLVGPSSQLLLPL